MVRCEIGGGLVACAAEAEVKVEKHGAAQPVSGTNVELGGGGADDAPRARVTDVPSWNERLLSHGGHVSSLAA